MSREQRLGPLLPRHGLQLWGSLGHLWHRCSHRGPRGWVILSDLLPGKKGGLGSTPSVRDSPVRGSWGVGGSPGCLGILGASEKGGPRQSGPRRLLRRPRGNSRPSVWLSRCAWVPGGPCSPRVRFPPPGSHSRRDRRAAPLSHCGRPALSSSPQPPGPAGTLARLPLLGSVRLRLGSRGRCPAAPSVLALWSLPRDFPLLLLSPVPTSSFLTPLELRLGLSLFPSVKPADFSNPYLAFFFFFFFPLPRFKILFIFLPTRRSGFGGLETANSTASGFNFGGFGLTANPAVNFNIGNFGVSTTSATPFNFGNSLASAGRYCGSFV